MKGSNRSAHRSSWCLEAIEVSFACAMVSMSSSVFLTACGSSGPDDEPRIEPENATLEVGATEFFVVSYGASNTLAFDWAVPPDLGTSVPISGDTLKVVVGDAAGTFALTATSQQDVAITDSVDVVVNAFARSYSSALSVPGDDGDSVVGAALDLEGGTLFLAHSLEGRFSVLAKWPAAGDPTSLSLHSGQPVDQQLHPLAIAAGTDATGNPDGDVYLVAAAPPEPGRLLAFDSNLAARVDWNPPLHNYLGVLDVGPGGNVYAIVDPTMPKLLVLDGGGNTTDERPLPPSLGNDIRGLVVESSGDVLVASGTAVVRWNRADVTETLYAAPPTAEIQDIAVDGLGRIYLAVFDEPLAGEPNGAIHALSSLGTEVAAASQYSLDGTTSRFQRPLEIAADAAGGFRVYDDVDVVAGEDPIAARVVAANGSGSVPKTLTLYPPGAVLKVGWERQFIAHVSGGGPQDVSWDESDPGAGEITALGPNSMWLVAGAADGTFNLRAQSTAPMPVEVTVPVTLSSFSYEFSVPFATPGVNGHVLYAAVAAAREKLFLAYSNDNNHSLMCIGLDTTVDQTPCSDIDDICLNAVRFLVDEGPNPPLVLTNVAAAPAGDAYWIQNGATEPEMLAQLARLRFDGTLEVFSLPSAPEFVFKGAIAVGDSPDNESEISVYLVGIGKSSSVALHRFDLPFGLGDGGALSYEDSEVVLDAGEWPSFAAPTDLAIDPRGRILFLMPGDHQLYRLDVSDGSLPVTLGSQHTFPYLIDIDQNGLIYVAAQNGDPNHTRVHVLNSLGDEVKSFSQSAPEGDSDCGQGTDLGRLLGLGASEDGRIRVFEDTVCDSGGSQIAGLVLSVDVKGE